MTRKCFMCGREISGGGILCDKCDKPRKPKVDTAPVKPAEPPPVVQQQAAPAAPSASQPARRQGSEAPQLEPDPFPKAPVLQFPVESASPAITSVVNLLVASGVASVLVGPDRSVKFVSDEAKRLFEVTASELKTLQDIETKAGMRVGELSVPSSAGVRINNRNLLFSVVPMSGGASGAALVFRDTDPLRQSHASFVTYVRETVFGPLRSLNDSLKTVASSRNDHFLSDAAAAIEQVLSSLELAPGVEEGEQLRPVPTVTEIVQRVADRFRAFADMKGLQLLVDVQDLQERFTDHEQLTEALAILMDNAMHYVPAGGQVVIGVRWMEHKGKPLLLFFVMDNGPVVPEPLRTTIFEPSFVWSPSSSERTGRGLFKTREFAVAHAGSVWVESKTGKACTFFLRVRPDGIR